ncbi:MAG: hypothetical protein M1342_01555 [Patescibacteria group bacterium]|nr:hypothetical protein [Patescibacteria group bacterium]
MSEQSLGFFPDAKIVGQTQGPPVRSISNPPKEIVPPDSEHLARHWQPLEKAQDSSAFLGSRFEPNDAFKDINGLAVFLQQAAAELIPAGQHERRHVVTVSFPYPIGRTAVTEIVDGENVSKTVRDAGQPGEAEVNTVWRDELPQTNLLTFDVKPVFPPKGSKGSIAFQISSAFPGEPAPRLITKARAENHARKSQSDPEFEADKAYWDRHAFIKLK